MSHLQYNNDGFALSSGFEMCHCCDADGAYIGEMEQYISIHCGLPARAYLDAPPTHNDDEWPARMGRLEPWIILPDLRGQTAYNTETKQPRQIKTLGALPADETLIAPSAYDDVWDAASSTWVAKPLTYSQELTALTAPYNADRDTLCAAWLRAAVADGTEETVRKEDVESEIAELDAQYDADVATLKTKYGVS